MFLDIAIACSAREQALKYIQKLNMLYVSELLSCKSV
jgi:hypothetical protein